MVSEKELIRGAKEIDDPPTWCFFWPAGLFYGLGKWLKKYGFYPQWLPLAIWIDHKGPTLWDHIPLDEKNTKASTNHIQNISM